MNNDKTNQNQLAGRTYRTSEDGNDYLSGVEMDELNGQEYRDAADRTDKKEDRETAYRAHYRNLSEYVECYFSKKAVHKLIGVAPPTSYGEVKGIVLVFCLDAATNNFLLVARRCGDQTQPPSNPKAYRSDNGNVITPSEWNGLAENFRLAAGPVFSSDAFKQAYTFTKETLADLVEYTATNPTGDVDFRVLINASNHCHVSLNIATVATTQITSQACPPTCY